jgi:hypothetical protein
MHGTMNLKYSSTLSLTSALNGVGCQRHVPAALLPGKRNGTHCIGGWVGPRGGLDGCGKSRPTGILSPARPVRSVSLYRLSYPRPLGVTQFTNNIHRTVIPFFTYDRTYFASIRASSGINSLRHGDFFFPVAIRFDSGSWPPFTGLPDYTHCTHHSQQDSSGRVISPKQRTLTTHNYQRHSHACPGGI